MTAATRRRYAGPWGTGNAVVVIEADGTYSQPGSALCGGDTLTTAEVGTWRPLRRGILLQLQNVAELVDQLAQCTDVGDIRIRRYRHRVLPRADGTIKVRTTMTGSVTVPQGRFPFVAVGHFIGTATKSFDAALDAVRGVP